VKRCPYAIVSARSLQAVQCASLVESGILPDGGGWLDQSAAMVDAMCEVATIRAANRKEDHQ
jgi:hypothetical protein